MHEHGDESSLKIYGHYQKRRIYQRIQNRREMFKRTLNYLPLKTLNKKKILHIYRHPRHSRYE